MLLASSSSAFQKQLHFTHHETITITTSTHQTLPILFTMSASADDQYEQQNDQVSGDAPAGDAQDNDYQSRTGQSHIPVQSDNADVEDPIDPETADSDAQLGMPCVMF